LKGADRQTDRQADRREKQVADPFLFPHLCKLLSKLFWTISADLDGKDFA